MKEDIAVKVQKQLFELQDLKYRDFHANLMPTIDKEKVIGVRTPVLRSYAKQFGKTEEAKEFMKVLPTNIMKKIISMECCLNRLKIMMN